MPRYFTDLQLGDLKITDEEGSETTSFRTARVHAVAALRMAADGNLTAVYKHASSAIVRDEYGNVLACVTLSLSSTSVPFMGQDTKVPPASGS